MNIKNFAKIRNLKNQINFNCLTGNKSNMFCINNNESDLHRYTKYKICVELVKRNYEVFTEVIFKNRKRADIVAINEQGEGFIFEIVNTESEESIAEKLDSYPIDFNVEIIKCGEPLELVI